MKQVTKLIVLTLTCLLNTTWTRAQGNMDYEMCITIRQHPRNEGASSGALSLEGSPVLRGPHGEEGGSRMCRCNTSKQQKDEIQALHETNKRLKQQIANNPNCARNTSRHSQAGTGGQGWNAGDQYPNRQQQPMMGQQQPMMDGYGRGQGTQYPNSQRQPMMGQQQQMMGGYGRDSGMQYPNRQQQMMGQQQPMMGGNGMNPGFHYPNGQQQQMMGGYGRTQGAQYPNRQQQGRMGQQQPMMGQQQPMMGLQRPNQQQPMMGQQQPMMGGYGRAPGMQYPNRQQQMMGQQQPMMGGYGRNPGGQYQNQQQPMIDQRQPMMGEYGRNPGMQYPSQQSQPGIGQQQPMMGGYGGNQGLQYPMQDSQMGMGRYERAVGPQNSTGRGDEGMDASDGEQARPPNPSRGPPAVTGGGESMNSGLQTSSWQSQTVTRKHDRASDVQHSTTMSPPVTNRSEETGGRQNEVEEPSQPMTGENNGTSDLGNGSEDYESEEVVEYETAAEYVEHCAVGMKDGRVSDDDIEASSAYSDDHGANHARLDYGVKPGQLGHQAWSSLTKTQGEWIQADLKSPALVTGVITQGRRDAHKSQWVTSFKISYGNSTSEMEAMRDGDGNEIIFTGNTDRNTYVMNRFPHTVVASYVRLIVWEWFGYISMRLEFITC